MWSHAFFCTIARIRKSEQARLRQCFINTSFSTSCCPCESRTTFRVIGTSTTCQSLHRNTCTILQEHLRGSRGRRALGSTTSALLAYRPSRSDAIGPPRSYLDSRQRSSGSRSEERCWKFLCRLNILRTWARRYHCAIVSKAAIRKLRRRQGGGQEVEQALQRRILEVVVVCISHLSRRYHRVAVQAVEVALGSYYIEEALYFREDTKDTFLDSGFCICASAIRRERHLHISSKVNSETFGTQASIGNLAGYPILD